MKVKQAYIVTGTLKGDRTLELDEPIGLHNYKVRVIVEPVEPLPAPSAQRGDGGNLAGAGRERVRSAYQGRKRSSNPRDTRRMECVICVPTWTPRPPFMQ